jgi:hypothetical protein
MKIEQKKWSEQSGWESIRKDDFLSASSNMVIAFGSRELFSDAKWYHELKKSYPNAIIIMNTTSGEIIDTQVNDETISVTAIQFEKTNLKTAQINISSVKNSYEAGKLIAGQFEVDDLSNIMVIADGQKVNGSELVEGLGEYLPKNTIITGGLAGDGSLFEKTLVGMNNAPTEGMIVAIGFYGKNIKVSHGSMGGWDPFGPERMITRSKGNILFELDGQPALDIYKKYLGEYSKDLPGSGLLFPLSVKMQNYEEPIVRTILSINEEEKSLTFAGNIPQGSYSRLMKANIERLIQGASNAAFNSMENLSNPELAILISCVGRKLVLYQRIEEEVEVIRETFGKNTAITGFYSYGEFSPHAGFKKCELHNQTMTITTLSEN